MIQIAKYSYCVVRNKLLDRLGTLNPMHLEIVNESNQHSVPKNSETHFKITIISNTFKEMTLIARHRKIYETIDDIRIKHAIHAISIIAKLPQEWNVDEITQSPKCLGGSKRQ